MAQNDILRAIQLACFKDEELKSLMEIPESEYNNMVAFRDNYLIADGNPAAFLDRTTMCRILMYWEGAYDTNNKFVLSRTLNFEIYVQRKHQYSESSYVFERRSDRIQQRLKALISRQSFEGFGFRTTSLGDLRSNNPEYARSFILFECKNIF